MAKVTFLLLAVLAVQGYAEESCTAGRLMLNDVSTPKVAVVDLDSGESVFTFAGEGMPASAYSMTATSDAVCASIIYRTTSGFVKILCSGFSFDDHGDHVDVEKKTPSVLPDTVTGDRPTYISAGFGQSVVSFDGTASTSSAPATQSYAIAFSDTKFSGAASMPPVFESEKMGQQHGNAGPLPNDHYFVSQPNPAYVAAHSVAGGSTNTSSRAMGFIVVKKDRTVVYNMSDASDPDRSCPMYHGNAQLGTTVMFGCATGILVLKVDTATTPNTFTSRRIPYHASGRTIGSFHFHRSQAVVIGQYSNATHYAFIRLQTDMDMASPKYEVARDLREFGSARPCRSGFEMAYGKAFLTMFTNGTVLMFDVSSGWTFQSSIQVSESFTCSGTFPFLVMGYNRAVVVYPNVQEARELLISGTTLKQGRTMKLPQDFKPSSGLVFGIPPSMTKASCPAEA